MTRVISSMFSLCMVALVAIGIATVHAQAPADFAGEPDKSMASAYQSFVDGKMDKSAEQIKKAANYVRKQEKTVAKGAAAGVKSAADDLDRLGAEVKKGTVKSADELKKTFAKVDHAMASAWYETAETEQKAGKDATRAAKTAGEGLEGAARWAGTKLDAGAQAAVDALRTAGRGARMGVDALGRAIQGLGSGIADVGKKISS